MDQWANNTLRTLGIIITSILVIIGSLVLVLLSMCAYGGVLGGSNKSTGIYYVIGLVVLVAIGGGTIAKLAHGIVRNPVPAGPPLTPVTATTDITTIGGPVSDALPHLSPGSRDAIRLLVYAIAAQ